MALELEQTIMTEIGLHSNYRWFNGSGSCAHIRRQAAERLREAIQRHHDAAEEIVPPDERLIEEVKRIARSVDESEYSLTKTWEACSYIVAAHIHAFHGQPEKVLADMANFLAEEYQPVSPAHLAVLAGSQHPHLGQRPPFGAAFSVKKLLLAQILPV